MQTHRGDRALHSLILRRLNNSVPLDCSIAFAGHLGLISLALRFVKPLQRELGSSIQEYHDRTDPSLRRHLRPASLLQISYSV